MSDSRQLDLEIGQFFADVKEYQEGKKKQSMSFFEIFSSVRKLLDFADDLWTMIRPFIQGIGGPVADLIGLGLTSFFGLFNSSATAYEEIDEAKENAADSKDKQGKMKTTMHIWNAGLAIAAAVFSALTFALKVAGVVAAGALVVLLAPIVSGVLFAISINKWLVNRSAYIAAKEKHDETKQYYKNALAIADDYSDFLEAHAKHVIELKVLFENIREKEELARKASLPESIQKKLTLQSAADGVELTPDEEKQYDSFCNAISQEKIYGCLQGTPYKDKKALIEAIAAEETVINEKAPAVTKTRNQYLQCREERLEAERELAYASCEVVGYGLGTTGLILALPAVGVEAMISTALIAVGSIAFIVIPKLFEVINEKLFHNKLADGIRNFFSPPAEKVLDKKQEATMRSTHANVGKTLDANRATPNDNTVGLSAKRTAVNSPKEKTNQVDAVHPFTVISEKQNKVTSSKSHQEPTVIYTFQR